MKFSPQSRVRVVNVILLILYLLRFLVLKKIHKKNNAEKFSLLISFLLRKKYIQRNF